MKKSILMLAVIFLINVESNAQLEKQEIASTSYSLHTGNTLNNGNPSFKFYTNPGYNAPVKDYDYYMRKKKNNLTAGLVTLGAGVVLSGVGLIISTNSNSFDNDATAGVLVIAGAASGIVSIPLMIMASVYGHKAKLELRNQKTGFGAPSKVSKNIPGLTISIPLRK